MLRIHQLVALLVVLIATLFGSSHPAAAGAVPRPLEADLDMANSVVVGRIVNITAKSMQDHVVTGRATVQVSQTLKGLPSETVDFTCPTDVLPGYDGSSVIRTYHSGDSGIWLIAGNGYLSQSLPEKLRPDVEAKLQRLSAREWSLPVNGLRAWAAVVESGSAGSDPVIIFAVQNITGADTFVPGETVPGFVTATATIGKAEFRYSIASESPVGDSVSCRKLPPGEITYLHPAYSYIDLRRTLKLADGQYSVIVLCENAQEQGRISLPGAALGPVTAWTGKVSAPAVDLLVETSDKTVK